ncbi:MAG TPA: hypothetical protein VNR66_08020, partial [Solirubrobacteraceae bacterium]|nr:hypothetical protein [Solirubrobacteraceae bacterium]
MARNVVEREGPHTNHVRNEADRAGNVVRFPRDWFGPPDELVPIGRNARPPDPPTSPPARTRTAADFWGEESATVHDALQPAPPKRVARTVPRVRPGVLELGRPVRRVLATPAALALALVVVAASAFLATRPGGSQAPRARSDTRGAVTTAATHEGTILAASVLEAGRHASRRTTPHVSAVRPHPTPPRSHHTIPAAASPTPAAAAPVSTPAAT